MRFLSKAKPEFYVVYTGERKTKPKTINLADEFFEGKASGIDVTVNMLYGETDICYFYKGLQRTVQDTWSYRTGSQGNNQNM